MEVSLVKIKYIINIKMSAFLWNSKAGHHSSGAVETVKTCLVLCLCVMRDYLKTVYNFITIYYVLAIYYTYTIYILGSEAP